MKRLLRDIIVLTQNKKNKQNSMHVKKLKLKELGLDIDDLLNTPLKNKLKKFEEG